MIDALQNITFMMKHFNLQMIPQISYLNEGFDKKISIYKCNRIRKSSFLLHFHGIHPMCILMMIKVVILFIYLFIISPAQANGTTISLPLEKINHQAKLQKRQATHKLQLYNNEGTEYLINIGIGTPIQNFTVSLDTGR